MFNELLGYTPVKPNIALENPSTVLHETKKISMAM